MSGQLLEDRQPPGSAPVQMLCDAPAHDRKHGQTRREDAERRKGGDARVCILVDSGVEVLEGGEERETLVVIGSAPRPAPVGGRRVR